MSLQAHTRKNALKAGTLLFGLSTLLFSIQFMLYIKGSNILPIMDFGGWAFFLTSCLSHAACVALIPFVLFLPFALFRQCKIGLSVMSFLIALCSILIFLNMQVYDIYRFHINGFVLNMVFGEGAGDIFTFDTMLYVKEGTLLLLFVALSAALGFTTYRLYRNVRKWVYTMIFSVAIGCTLFAHVYHIYASFMQKSSVIKSSVLLPYYFPTTSYSTMVKMGFVPPVNNLSQMSEMTSKQEDVVYPRQTLACDSTVRKPNIVMILLDSWNKRSLTPECMPITYQYAQNNQWYDNHFGCSNGTRSSIFGLFFSVPSIYWDSFEAGNLSPVFIDELQRQGYSCQVYPSASLMSPPFFRVVFQNIPDLNIVTEGANVLECDTRLTDNFISDMRKNKAEGKPFFSLLFYDLPHSFSLPQERLNRFEPTWQYADYTVLDNDADPTPFFNLYRHCCYEDDILVGRVLDALKEEGLADNTIVVITGDHGQEFNENKKNFWGHNGNFSQWQIAVPLIVGMPESIDSVGPKRYTHRTTHYDIIPTLMNKGLGVRNDISDYSAGHLLDDTVSRNWHLVGSELNYAFIVEGDTILEKTAQGTLDVYDPQMNPVENYNVNPREFNEAIKRMNMFYKQ